MLCVLFALVGLVPLGVGWAARFDAVQAWLARETAAALRSQLGVEARYELSLRPWPLEIDLDNVRVDASDGGGPFLEASRAVARPRIFSLLGGKLDLGEVVIESPRVRVVVRGGQLANLKVELPETRPRAREEAATMPLSSVAITDGWLDLDLEGVKVQASHVDFDLTADEGPLELAVRAGLSRVERRHPSAARPNEEQLDEDVLCRIEARAKLSPGELLVRRLRLVGALDLDPDAGTAPRCDLGDDDWRRLELRLESTRVALADGAPRSLDGRVWVRAPAGVAHRLVKLPPVGGWFSADLEAHYDGSTKLPVLRGGVIGEALSIDSRVVARSFRADVDTAGDRIRVTDIAHGWAGGTAKIREVTIEPLAEGIPLHAQDIEVSDVQMADMLDDLCAHPHAHVAWLIEHASVAQFGGTLDPLALSGPMRVSSRDFGVFDRPSTDANRWRIFGVQQGNVAGTFKVQQDAVVLAGFDVNTGRSHLQTSVHIGFDEKLGITVAEGGVIDLADISPLAGIPMSGRASLRVDGHGVFDRPLIEADLSVRDFVLGGFPLGHVEHSRVHFEPLAFDITQGQLSHGQSTVEIPRMRMDFDAGATVVLDVDVDSRTRQGLWVHDFFDIVHFADDPRLAGIDAQARGLAKVHYELGGRVDRCRSGNLRVDSQLELANATAAGERFESGAAEGTLRWEDMNAGTLGVALDLRSAVLRKGPGTVVARGHIELGGQLRLDVTGASIPLDRLSAYEQLFGPTPPPAGAKAAQPAATAGDAGGWRVRPEGSISLMAAVSGSVAAPAVRADVELGTVRIGPESLPSSRLHVELEPAPEASKPTAARTVCGYPRAEPFDPARYAADAVAGVIRISGSLFDEQVHLDDVEVTQQRAAVLSGLVSLQELDLGVLANLIPGVAFSSSPPHGKLSATVHIDELPLEHPGLAEVRVFLNSLELEKYGHRIRVGQVDEPAVLSGDALRIPKLPLTLRLSSGLTTTLATGGTVESLTTRPTLDLALRLDPVDLRTLGMELPQVDRAEGRLSGDLRVRGPFSEPALSGSLALHRGALRLRGFPLALDDIEVAVAVSPSEIQVHRAEARVGGSGTMSLEARLPLQGLDITGATATLDARNIKVPVADGVKLTANANLRASYTKSSDPSTETLPSISGSIEVLSFAYTRPIAFSVDLDQLTGRGPTEVDVYDPQADVLQFDVTVLSPEPLTVRNNLLDMQIEVTPPGLQLSGTNQRFGARGGLRVAPGGKIALQGHDFAVRDGTVTFDHATRIAPRLDVRAVTEYRRYASSAQTDAATSAAAGSTASTGGTWRIEMHATGDTDALQVQFTSDPALAQDDIVLLLQIGMTRAELDRTTAGALAQSVGLEALSMATGIDQAVRKSVPLIDEFRLSSQYSSRTGRTEPTATVGKRITDDIRASVTTGLSDNRELRSNVEWQLGNGLSVEGSYDNINNVSSTGIGNLGADLRWRLEFE